MMFGKAKGYLWNISQLPKISGCFTAGLASAPPKAGPKMLPIVQTKGIILNARGCSSFSGTSSATMVLIMPTLPFMSPKNTRAVSRVVRDLENPNTREKIMVDARPRRMAYLRPYRSENVPHCTAMMHWHPARTADDIPTHFATSFLRTPTLSIISGWGKLVSRMMTFST